jgi:acyl CoA:acetate/3-ketoacid CoA transferase alpha subunit/acyl CoA:acetate/3-ketoacid CoA transferase beta subunit
MTDKLFTNKDGEDKVLSLGEAIRRFVRPGMALHLAAGIGGPSAAICEIIRQYRRKDPGFTVIQSTMTGHGLNLVHCGIVKKLICSVSADISASARPSRIVQKAYAEKSIVLENWSLLSLQQRLMAAALGVPFMPTRSVKGSSIATDRGQEFIEMDDPFDTGERVGLVQALYPDISIVHGCVADRAGNVVLTAPYGEDIWGSLAAGSVIVTVEKIVPTDFIREYSTLVKIPSYMVEAVCVAPLGLHPYSLPNPGIRDFEPYEKDVDFLVAQSKASREPAALEEWIDRWVTGCATHEEYLNKVGEDQIRDLKERSKVVKTITTSSQITQPGPEVLVTPKETMFVVLAREVVRAIKENGHRLVLAGAGAGSTAAFMAYYQLRPEGIEIELITGNGQVAYTPVPGESILASEAGVRTCKMLTDTIMTQGVFVGGKRNKCLSALGAGQIDRFGNTNSTVTSGGQFLVGSGGANDAMNAREVIVALDQTKERFADKLPYVTARGGAVATVVSTMGVFKKTGPDDELCLAACFSDGGKTTLEEKIETVRANCGWPLRLMDKVDLLPEPTGQELGLLRWLDGKG